MRNPYEILLVEDNPADAGLALEAFMELNHATRLHIVADGVEAWDFLQREGRYKDVPRPDVILLDLNLPRKTGRELLLDIKQHADLKRIPTVVMTTSRAREDIVQSYDLHANCYVVKPLDFAGFCALVGSVADFWLSVVELPSERRRLSCSDAADEVARSLPPSLEPSLSSVTSHRSKA